MWGGFSFFDNTAYELIFPIQGWNNIYFKPLKLPILNFGFLFRRPFNKLFISVES